MNREKLVDVLNITKNFLDNQNFIPILSHHCFDKNKVVAYNGSQGISVDFESGLEVGIDSKFLDILNSFKDNEISLSAKDSSVIVETEKSKIKLPTLPKSDFIYKIPEVSDKQAFEVTEDFLTGIKKCLTIAEKNQLHLNICGVTVQAEDNKLFLYSTNGEFVSRYLCKDSIEAEFKVLLSNELCKKMLTIKDNILGGIIFIEKNIIRIDTENSTFFSITDSELDVELLDYSKIFKKYKVSALDYFKTPEDFTDILQRSVILTKNSLDKSVDLEISQDKISVKTKSENDRAEEQLQILGEVMQCQFTFDAPLLKVLIDEAVNEIGVLNSDTNILVGKSDNFLVLMSSLDKKVK